MFAPNKEELHNIEVMQLLCEGISLAATDPRYRETI